MKRNFPTGRLFRTVAVGITLALLVPVSSNAGSEKPTSPITIAARTTACPADAYVAAYALWPTANALGQRVRVLTGKHSCGRWVRCARKATSKNWTCTWKDSVSR